MNTEIHQDTYTLTLPLCVFLPRKTRPARKCILNLNNYRNWQFHLSNALKHAYCTALEQQLSGLTLKPPILLKFTLYRGNRRLGDRSNVLSVQEKFLCDALTHYGCITDDNDDYIAGTSYRTGAIDKANPRVECEILENYCE
jgi:Holliday junction resolvase RusA-like endonuclease